MKNWNWIRTHNKMGCNVQPAFGKLAEWSDFLYQELHARRWRLCANEDEYEAFIYWAHAHQMNVVAEGAPTFRQGMNTLNYFLIATMQPKDINDRRLSFKRRKDEIPLDKLVEA